MTKITKTMKLDAIVSILKGEAIAEGITTEMLIEFAEHEKELIAKKTSGKTEAQTKADEKLDAAIMTALESVESATATAIADMVKKGDTEFAQLSTSKTTSRLGALAKKGFVFREVVKGKALYSAI